MWNASRLLKSLVPGVSTLPSFVRGRLPSQQGLVAHNLLRQIRIALAGKDLARPKLDAALTDLDTSLHVSKKTDLLEGFTAFLASGAALHRMQGAHINQAGTACSSQVRLVASLRKRASRAKLYRMDDEEFARAIDSDYDPKQPSQNRLVPWNTRVMRESEDDGRPALIQCRDPRFFWTTSAASVERDLGTTPTNIYNNVGKKGPGLLIVEIRIPPERSAGQLLVPTVFDTFDADILLFRPGSRSSDSWGRSVRFSSTEDGYPEALHTASVEYRHCSYRILGRTVFQEEPDDSYYRDLAVFSRRQASQLW